MNSIKINLIKYLLISFILLFSVMSFAAEAPVEVGKVSIVFGKEIKAIDVNKTERVLTRQSPIYQGDTLVTGKDSRVQVRFLDDTALSLRPESEVRVDEYKFDSKNPEQNKNFASLLKGGFRTLTGAIAKNDPSKYRMTTPVAIIGVRGTDYIAVIQNGGLYASVVSGKITIKNDSGGITLGQGEKFSNAFVSSVKTLPEGILDTPPAINSCTVK